MEKRTKSEERGKTPNIDDSDSAEVMSVIGGRWLQWTEDTTRCHNHTSNLIHLSKVHLIPRCFVILLAAPCPCGIDCAWDWSATMSLSTWKDLEILHYLRSGSFKRSNYSNDCGSWITWWWCAMGIELNWKRFQTKTTSARGQFFETNLAHTYYNS